MIEEAKIKERKERTAKRRNEGFREFMDNPMTRMGFSSLGDIAKNDTLNLLLSAAFEAGFSCGTGDMISDLCETMMDSLGKAKKGSN